MSASDSGGVAAVVEAMQVRLDGLTSTQSAHRAFLSTYQRTTVAVAEALDRGVFEDASWVEAWDVAFARLYLGALDADLLGTGRVPRPWRLAFDAPAGLPALRHVLLGINAHINYDLPQALLAVIGDQYFDDPELLGLRRRDHGRVDGVLSGRVAAESHELASRSGMALLDRILQPLNRRASKRFLSEARQKVWHNTLALHAARRLGPEAYAVRLGELEVLSAARIADLLAPGQVLLRLGVSGFGIVLPPVATPE